MLVPSLGTSSIMEQVAPQFLTITRSDTSQETMNGELYNLKLRKLHNRCHRRNNASVLI